MDVPNIPSISSDRNLRIERYLNTVRSIQQIMGKQTGYHWSRCNRERVPYLDSIPITMTGNDSNMTCYILANIDGTHRETIYLQDCLIRTRPQCSDSPLRLNLIYDTNINVLNHDINNYGYDHIIFSPPSSYRYQMMPRLAQISAATDGMTVYELVREGDTDWMLGTLSPYKGNEICQHTTRCTYFDDNGNPMQARATTYFEQDIGIIKADVTIQLVAIVYKDNYSNDVHVVKHSVVTGILVNNNDSVGDMQ